MTAPEVERPTFVGQSRSPRRAEVRLVPESKAFRFTKRRSGYELFVKPAIDRSLAAIALVVVSPVMLVIALVVRVTMGPGVIFTQDRIGRGETRFTAFKFRTMRHDRRSSSEPMPPEADRRRSHKRADNPLITTVGRFLRKWSLDELPQLINVVRGDMSLVGPRPELVSVVERYEPWQHRRHEVKPGVTGLWQITARSEGPAHQNTQLDIAYVDSISLRTDLRILFKTPAAMLGDQRGF
jgi:lipopolysaccharide/colanic/teichoic acid biosynthesis glycosyltransferase